MMAVLSQLLPPLNSYLLQHYASFDALKKNMQDWAVREKYEKTGYIGADIHGLEITRQYH